VCPLSANATTLMSAFGCMAGITCACFASGGKLLMASSILSVALITLPLVVTTCLLEVPVCLNPAADFINKLIVPESNIASFIASSIAWFSRLLVSFNALCRLRIRSHLREILEVTFLCSAFGVGSGGSNFGGGMNPLAAK